MHTHIDTHRPANAHIDTLTLGVRHTRTDMLTPLTVTLTPTDADTHTHRLLTHTHTSSAH